MHKFAKYFIFVILISGVFLPTLSKAVEEQKEQSWMKIFPECIQQQMNAKPGETFSKECDDIGVFIQLAINIGAYLFTFIGALALLVFVYGGFKMIISAGDSAKIKEGKDAMVAAVIGIVIAFSGVAIVRFLGESLKLKEVYRLNNPVDKEICCKIPDEKQQSVVPDGNIEILNYRYIFVKEASCPSNAEVLTSITDKAGCEKLNN